MSAALAYPRPVAQPAPRHIEIVTTRAQRRARPRSFYAFVAVSTVFALFIAQLLLSILLSDGAYQISSLQSQQKDLLRSQESLAEQLDLLASPQSLSMRAEALGMVVGSSAPAFLRLADGSLVGTPVAANGGGGVAGANGGLVANALLSELAQSASAPTATDAEGAPSQPAPSASVASGDGSLPSPVTR